MPLKRTMVNGLVNRIKLVGVELEGCWEAVPPVKDGDHEGIEHDGSVVFERGTPLIAPRPPAPTIQPVMDANGTITMAAAPQQHPHIQVPNVNRGEVVLRRPHPPGSPELEEWVRRCYPKYVNETCGLHVHISFFNRLNYQRLMTPVFTTEMVESLKRWAERENLDRNHPLWPRLLSPNHRHCAHVYLGDGQVRINRKDYNSRGTPYSRYTALNYCDKQHGTVECRLLCMMEDADQALRAINAVVDTTNRFLSKFREREVKVRAHVPRKDEVIISFPGRLD